MGDIKSIDKKIFNILLAYIKKNYQGDTLFCCISGCSNRLVKYIEENLKMLQNDEYCILSIYEEKFDFSFNEIVKIRNDKRIKKVAIFTNGSINNVDSLKDFIQLDIKKIPFIDLWNIIQDECLIDWKTNSYYKKIERFLKDIVEIVQPEIYKLVEYIERANEESMIYNDLILALNTNLYLFDIWCSVSDTVLGKSRLQVIYHNSDPIQIHKKITSPSNIENIQRKFNIDKRIDGRFYDLRKQKNILKNMFYERKYNEAYKEIYYELIEGILKGGVKKQITKNDKEENACGYTNLYSLTLGALSQLDSDIKTNINDIRSINSFEKLNFDNDTQEVDYSYRISIPYYTSNEKKNEDVFINLEDAKVKWDHFQNIFANVNDGNDILKICDSLNIHSEDKIELKNKLSSYFRARYEFVKKWDNPIKLNELLDDSMMYVSMFFEIVKLLYSFRQGTRRNIAISGILNKLVNLDIEVRNDEIYVPYYSPILIFHLHNMRSRYEKCLIFINEMNVHKFETLEQINTKVLNEHIIYENNTYLLTQDNDGFPYYIKYVREEYIDSIIKINLGVITPYIVKYVEKNPYKNILKICLIGEVDLKSLKSALLKILNKITVENLKHFRIKIITKSPNDVREVLISLFEQKEGLNKRLQCTIERLDKNINLEDYVENLILENDMTFLLDSSIMYLKTRFNKKNDNYLERAVNYRNITSEINSLSYVLDGRIENMPVTPNVISVLENSIENENLQYEELDKYNLNINLISSINKILNQVSNGDKDVILLSSNSKIDEQIIDNYNLVEIEETINISNKIKVLTFSNCKIKRNEYTFINNNKYIEFTVYDLLDSFALNDSIDFSSGDINYEDIIIRVSYKDFPQQINITYYITEEYDEELRKQIDNQCGIIYDMFISVAINPKLFLDYHDRETFIKLMLRNSNNEEDVVFIYSFENIYDVHSGYGGFIEERRNENAVRISSINRNTMYRILKFLGEEAISEQAINAFFEMLKVNNFSVEYLPMLNNLVSKYNHKYIKYLYENICVVIKELEVK